MAHDGSMPNSLASQCGVGISVPASINTNEYKWIHMMDVRTACTSETCFFFRIPFGFSQLTWKCVSCRQAQPSKGLSLNQSHLPIHANSYMYIHVLYLTKQCVWHHNLQPHSNFKNTDTNHSKGTNTSMNDIQPRRWKILAMQLSNIMTEVRASVWWSGRMSKTWKGGQQAVAALATVIYGTYMSVLDHNCLYVSNSPS